MSNKQKALNLTRIQLEQLIKQHHTITNIVRFLTGGKNNDKIRAIVSQRIKQENLQLILRQQKFSYTVEQVKQAFKEAICWSDIFRKLNVSICGHNKKSIIEFAKLHGLEIPTFTKQQLAQAYKRGGKNNIQITQTVYCENSKVARASLRQRVLRDDVLRPYICSVCFCEPFHNGKPLTLELDHINGISNDNRIENLRWICPNCHSQTTTYKGKNKRNNFNDES